MDFKTEELLGSIYTEYKVKEGRGRNKLTVYGNDGHKIKEREVGSKGLMKGKTIDGGEQTLGGKNGSRVGGG